MQVVREQKIEYKSSVDYGVEDYCFLLCFLLSDGVFEKEGANGFRLRQGEAVLLSERGRYTLRADDAIIVTFSMSELKNLPLSKENVASLMSDLKIERGAQFVMVYFRDLKESFFTRANDLVEEYSEQKMFREPILRYELGSLLLRLTRYVWRVVTVRQESDSERVRGMLNYMLSRFKTVSLEEVAEAFNYHPNTAAALLKKNTGKTFSELLLEIRMVRVAEAMREGKPVSEAAAACGYSNMSNFYRRFKQYYGKTPAAYVSEIRKKEKTC